MKKWMTVLLVILVLVAGWSACVVVSETDLVVITRFGGPTRVLTEAGLYFKAPAPIDRAVYFDRRLLTLDIPRRDDPPREFLTLDKKNIEVACYACWRITDPLQFMRTLGSRADAEAVLRDVVLSAGGKILASYPLGAMFAVNPEQMKLAEITDAIRGACEEQMEKAYGVDIVDVRLKRINLPDANRASVFERMRNERKRFASQYLNEGEKEAARIRAEAKTREQEILGKAYEEQKRIEGEAEARAYAIYAEAFGQDPQFYEFLRSLESYEKTLTQNTTLFIPADHPYLKGLVPWLPPPSASDDTRRLPPKTDSEGT